MPNFSDSRCDDLVFSITKFALMCREEREGRREREKNCIVMNIMSDHPTSIVHCFFFRTALVKLSTVIIYRHHIP